MDLEEDDKLSASDKDIISLRKRERDHIHDVVARFAYIADVPFDAFSSPSFYEMCEALGGGGYKGPTEDELWGPLLKKAVKRTRRSVEEHKVQWRISGCTIMVDAWTDRERRSIMNVCVHCSRGTIFYKSIDNSKKPHTGPYIFQRVNECIEDVGADHVVQIVTNNASVNMAAKDLMREKRPNILWTACAGHIIDLMFEGIAKIPQFKEVIDKARALIAFIYSHDSILELMHRCTKSRDLMWPKTTRFATYFPALKSLVEQEWKLKYMFSEDEWTKCKLSRSAKGKAATTTVMSNTWWHRVGFLLKVYGPLFKLLRVVDSLSKPSIGSVVGMLEDAKKEIMKACEDNESKYKPILDIITEKGNRLDSPLYWAGYYLNPYYYYRDEKVQNNTSAINAVLACMKIFCPDRYVHDIIINVELLKYKNAEDNLGIPMAVRQRSKIADNFDPAHWWYLYGSVVPHLQHLAMKILSLTSSSSGSERSWIKFKGIHSENHYGLDSARLDDLIYVKFNARIESKVEKEIMEATKATKAQAKPVEDANSYEEENDVFTGSRRIEKVVGEALQASKILNPRKCIKGAGSDSFSCSTRDEEEEPLATDEEMEDDDVVFDDDVTDDEVWRSDDYLEEEEEEDDIVLNDDDSDDG